MAYGSDPNDNPYAPPQAELGPLADLGPTKAYGYAGFWVRFAAYFIDLIVVSIIIGIPTTLLKIAVLGWPQSAGPGQLPTLRNPAALPVGLLAFTIRILGSLLYYAGMESSRHQATLGKMALGLKVIDLDGFPISFARATGRFFGKILSGVICCIGFIMAAFNDRKQALHDQIVGTYVVRTRP